MKKQLFSIALVSAAFVSFANAELTTLQRADLLSKYITMEQGHKAKWFDYAKEMQAAKMDLIKKHHLEYGDLAKRNLAELGKNKNVDSFFDVMLAEKIALHKKHMKEWKTLSTNWFEKARAQGENEAGELAEFEGVEETADEPIAPEEVE